MYYYFCCADVGSSSLVDTVRKANLDDGEIQSIIDILLDRQGATAASMLSWNKVLNSVISFFFFFCVPSFYLWGSPFFGEILIFAHVAVFNPTIEVVTFHLLGWCMLGVFLLLAITCLRVRLDCEGHGKHVCTD